MSLSFLNKMYVTVNEVDRELNQDSISSCQPKDLIESAQCSYIYGTRGSKCRESKKFYPNNKVESSVQLRISIVQKRATNIVLSHFAGHQPWYWHFFNSDESDNKSDSVVTTYIVAVGNCSLMTAHANDIRWVDSVGVQFSAIWGGKS